MTEKKHIYHLSLLKKCHVIVCNCKDYEKKFERKWIQNQQKGGKVSNFINCMVTYDFFRKSVKLHTWFSNHVYYLNHTANSYVISIRRSILFVFIYQNTWKCKNRIANLISKTWILSRNIVWTQHVCVFNMVSS